MIIHLFDAHSTRHAAASASLLPAFLCRLRFPRLRPAAEDAPVLPSGLTVAHQQAHADAMHYGYATYADEQQYPRGEHPYPLPQRKPMVNRQPWATAELPVYGETSVANVIAAERTRNPAAVVLEDLAAELRRPAVTYRGGWQ